jgi:glycogen(starch) synthase
MRVLMSADAVGGVWTYATALIDGLADEVEVFLVVMGPAPSPEQRRRLRQLPLAGYAERTYALEWMEEPWDDVERAGAWLLELQGEVGADLVHLNGFAHGALPFGVPVVVVGHSCVLSWHEAVHGRPAGRAWDPYRAAVRRGLAFVDALVAPTRAMLSELERLYRPGCERLAIANGRTPGRRPTVFKERLILAAGRVWDEAKNLAALERVAPELDWPVVVAGEGGELGRVDEAAIQDLYSRAAIFAEPARYEPFGLAALEAAQHGCALVLGDIPSLREVWADDALYVDPFDDRALAETLHLLIADVALRERLGAGARHRASSYSGERMATAYRALYERALASQPLQAAV